MPGPGTGPRPGGWETLLYGTISGSSVVAKFLVCCMYIPHSYKRHYQTVGV